VIWLNPAALFALAVVAAPIVIHILVQRRAEQFAFPTLRFLRPTRLAAIRRHVLEDVLLLAVRAAILAAAVAALAGPLVVTSARRQLWQQRIVRATVVDLSTPEAARASPASDRPFRSQTFAAPSLADGISRAVAWLETMPPARRELMVVSPFAIGSITAAHLARVPADVGIRLERSGTLPPARTIPFGRLLTSGGTLDRDVTLAGAATVVRDLSPSPGASQSSFPIEIVTTPAGRPAAAAAIAAVLALRVWMAAPDRRGRLMVLDAGAMPNDPDVAQIFRSFVSNVQPIRVPSMADAVARIARDADLQLSARREAHGAVDARFSSAPWQPIVGAANGQVLVAAASSGPRVMLMSAAAVTSVVTPILIRAMANALATIPDLQSAEVVPIADETLGVWSRPSSAPPTPRLDVVDEDDRRWLWLATLVLLAIETWIRRARTRDAAAGDREAARVA
jgi:hypothetical protein